MPSDDGKYLVSASNDQVGYNKRRIELTKQTARVWDFGTGETKAELRGHEHVVECAVFAPVAAYAAIRELGGLQVAAGDTRARAPGAFVATGSRDKTIRLWDAVSGQCVRVLVSDMTPQSLTAQSGHDNWVRALVFHPSGKYLLSASDDKTIRVWELANGRCVKTIEAHSHFVTCLTWGRALMGGSGDGASANGGQEPRRINVIASGSVDQSIKVS